MSLQTVEKLKFARGFVSQAIHSKVLNISRRLYASVCPKENPLPSRAQLTARSPAVLSQALSGEGKQEERPLPQHEPGLYALMPPLRAVESSNLLNQQNILNGKRQQDSEVEDCYNISQKERTTQKLKDLLRQQYKLDKNLLDSQDRLRDNYESRNNIEQAVTRGIKAESLKAKRSLAKDLGPPVNPKSEVRGHIPKEVQFRPSSTDSPTLLVASKFLQEAQRSKQNKPNEELLRQQISFQPGDIPRPDYDSSTSQSHMETRKQSILNFQNSENHEIPKPKYPVNVVRPDIPPLILWPLLTPTAYKLQKSRASKKDLLEKEHSSWTADWKDNRGERKPW